MWRNRVVWATSCLCHVRIFSFDGTIAIVRSIKVLNLNTLEGIVIHVPIVKVARQVQQAFVSDEVHGSLLSSVVIHDVQQAKEW